MNRYSPIHGFSEYEEDSLGELVLFREASSLLTASEARVRKLEELLGEMVKFCRCGGVGWEYGHEDSVHDCPICFKARSVLGDVTATKGEAK